MFSLKSHQRRISPFDMTEQANKMLKAYNNFFKRKGLPARSLSDKKPELSDIVDIHKEPKEEYKPTTKNEKAHDEAYQALIEPLGGKTLAQTIKERQDKTDKSVIPF